MNIVEVTPSSLAPFVGKTCVGDTTSAVPSSYDKLSSQTESMTFGSFHLTATLQPGAPSSTRSTPTWISCSGILRWPDPTTPPPTSFTTFAQKGFAARPDGPT